MVEMIYSVFMVDRIVKLYFFMLPLIVFTLSFTNMVEHGRIKGGISKNYFIIFYISSLVFNILIRNYNFYLIHIFRRIFECVIFRYKQSRMKFVQLVHGCVYYIFMSLHLRNKCIGNVLIFSLLNLIHFISHYCVFKMRIFVFSHYIGELLIYMYLYYKFRSMELFYNFVYLVIFCLLSIRSRQKNF